METRMVAIQPQGAMGAGIASRLVSDGVRVLTCLDGRSTARGARARASGMEPVGLAGLAEEGALLSILPPAEALPTAQRRAPLLARRLTLRRLPDGEVLLREIHSRRQAATQPRRRPLPLVDWLRGGYGHGATP